MDTVKKILLILFLIIASKLINAKEKGGSVILQVKQRVSGKGTLQQGVVLKKKNLAMIRNSNFFCGVAEVVLLGHFKRASTKKDIVSYGFFREVKKRLKDPLTNIKLKRVASEIHQVEYYLGNSKIQRKTASYNLINEYMSNNCDLRGWKPVVAVSAEINIDKDKKYLMIKKLDANKAAVLTSKKLLRETQCRQVGVSKKSKAVWECPVEDFGYARIVEPS